MRSSLSGAARSRASLRLSAPAPRVAGARRCLPGNGCMGKVYRVCEAGVIVRIQGLPPLPPTVYELEKLRCHLSGRVFTAQAAAEIGKKKYDETAVSMTILQLMAENQAPAQPKIRPPRTGLFTSGIISKRGAHLIALFFTGRHHAGENLKEVLEQRAQALSPPCRCAMGSRATIPGVRDAPRQLPRPRPAPVGGGGAELSRGSALRARDPGRDLAKRCARPRAKTSRRESTADGATARLARASVPGANDRAELKPGRGDRLCAQALAGTDAFPL